MKKELNKYREILDFGSQHGSDVWKEDCDEEQMGSAGDAFLEISQIFLRRMKQAELAEYLLSGKLLGQPYTRLTKMKNDFTLVYVLSHRTTCSSLSA